MTRDQWLIAFREKHPILERLINLYHPFFGKVYPHLKITAPSAEQARQAVVKEITKVPNVALMLRSGNAEQLQSILNETWFGMPESESVRHEPGFFDLCGLCEGWDD